MVSLRGRHRIAVIVFKIIIDDTVAETKPQDIRIIRHINLVEVSLVRSDVHTINISVPVRINDGRLPAWGSANATDLRIQKVSLDHASIGNVDHIDGWI